MEYIIKINAVKKIIHCLSMYHPLFTFLFLCFFTYGALADTIEVNDISQFNTMTENIQPGDRVVIANGVYKNASLKIKGFGTTQKKISIEAEVPGGVLLTGESEISVSGAYIEVSGIIFDQSWKTIGSIVTFNNARKCRLSECVFIESGNPKSTFYHIITFKNSSQKNTVDHCYMQGNLSMGIGVKVNDQDFNNTFNVIEYIYFKNIISRYKNGQESVQIGQGASSRKHQTNTTVKFCLFENASGDCEIISSKSSSNYFLYNTFRNCLDGLVLRGGNKSVVKGNFFFNTTTGVRIHGEAHTIANNYFENVKRSIYLGSGTGYGLESAGGHQATGNCMIAHNSIINSRNIGIFLGGEDLKAGRKEPCFNNFFINNIIFSNMGFIIKDNGSKGTVWINNMAWAVGKAKLGLTEKGIKVETPWIEKKDTIYSINEKSGAVNNGTYIMGLDDDIEGQKRDRYPDIGCDEVSTAPATRKPLMPQEVGPTWMKGDINNITRIKNIKPIPLLPLFIQKPTLKILSD